MLSMLTSFDYPSLAVYVRKLVSTAVIPNRGAAKMCQGCRQIRNYCILLMFYKTRCHQIVIFNQLGVPKRPEGCQELKKVEKHCSTGT